MSRTPSFALRDAPAATRRRGEWLALAVLVLAFAGQLFFGERAVLAANAQWRPLVVAACDVARCSLPPWREPTAFTMLARDVIAVPQHFRNDARWAQAWPALVLTLSDADNRTLGARRFLPRDYLGDAPSSTLLAPGQASQLAFDIVEPAPNVVAFDFRFD
jgi:hypothetical protein